MTAMSPRSSKRELHSIYPGGDDACALDEKLRALFAADETAETDEYSDASSAASTTASQQSQDEPNRLCVDDPNAALNNGRPTSNSDWWNPKKFSGDERPSLPPSPGSTAPPEQQWAAAFSNGSASRNKPEYLCHPQVLSPTRVKLPPGYPFSSNTSSSSAALNPELTARTGSHMQRKTDLERKVSSILSTAASDGQADSTHPRTDVTSTMTSVPPAVIGLESTQEKLDRYIRQVKELLKDSGPRKANLHQDDRQRLSMILLSLQKAVLLDAAAEPPPETVADTNRSSTTSAGYHSRANHNVPLQAGAARDQTELKYRRMYPR